MRPQLLATLLAAIALSALVFAAGAGAQRGGSSEQANQSGRGEPKRRVFVGRGSDTKQGSRVTITADDTLKDYSAYRSGDRFYVVLPKAAAGGGARGGAGRGYSDMQVQQRGDSVVLSYRVQPGAKPRVEQKFNRLDVVFDVPGGGQPEQAAAPTEAAPNRTQQPAESRNPSANAQQNSQATPTAAQPNTNAANARRTPTSEEAARVQAANTQPVNPATPQASNVVPPGAETGPQGGEVPAPTPSQEVLPSPTPAVEPQLAQAQPPTAIAPITTNTPAANPGTAVTLGTYLLQNWWILVLVLLVVGLGLVMNAQRSSSAGPPPVENLGEGGAVALDEPRAARVREASTATLRESSPTPQAHRPEAAEVPGEVSKPLVAASALAGGAAVAKSKKQTKKEARHEAKRKKKGGRGAGARDEGQDAEETSVAAPVVRVPAQEETLAETPTVEEAHVEVASAPEAPVEEPYVEEAPVVVEEPSPASSVAEIAPFEESGTPEAAEVLAAPAVEPERASEATTETAVEPAFDAVEAAGTEAEVAPSLTGIVPVASAAVHIAAGRPEVAEDEVHAPVTEIEPAVAPEPDRVLAETRRLLEGDAYDRAVIGTRDPVARQMIAAELLSALAGRNAQRRERAGSVFVEQGYFDETARDLREADAPAERAAAARSLALLGDRAATPHLVAALEDPTTDVRRAAVEALGALRDPAAVVPLEALLERERDERNRIPQRVIRNAAETCREGAAELRAEAPAPETREIVPAAGPAAFAEPSPEAEPARAVEVASTLAPAAHELAPFVDLEERDEETSLEIEPVAEPELETETPLPVEVAASEPVGETSVSLAPFVEEHGVEPTQEAAAAEESHDWFASPAAESREVVEESLFFGAEAPTDVAGSQASKAEVSEELNAAEPQSFETAVAEPEAVVETGIQPLFEGERYEGEVVEEPEAARGTEVGLEPSLERPAGVSSAQADAAETGQAGLFEEDRAEVTREIVPAPAASADEAATSPGEGAAAAGDWFEFDINEMSSDRQVSSNEPAAARTHEHAEVFESSSGETLVPPTSVEAPTFHPEPAPFVATRDEVPTLQEPYAAGGYTEAREEQVPEAAVGERGLAPFDELSTVPASIQQRLASREASERAAAIVELSHVDTDEAFQQICAGFDDEAKEVRSAAARALYELRADRADSFTRALREATPERRREIGAALASSGLASESISQLTGESREKTYEAFSLLFLMAKAGEVQPLVRAIEGHPNNEVRLAVVKLLALSGQKEILPAFRRLAVRGSLPTEVRSAVMEAIYQISSSQPTHAA